VSGGCSFVQAISLIWFLVFTVVWLLLAFLFFFEALLVLVVVLVPQRAGTA